MTTAEPHAKRRFTPEHKAALVANHVGMTGQKHSEEARAKMSASRKAYLQTNGIVAYVRTEEIRAKQSAAMVASHARRRAARAS